MKDVALKKNDDGSFDWDVQRGDVVTLHGNYALLSGVIHAVLLRPGELDMQAYASKGCTAYSYLKELGSENTINAIQDSIRASVNNLDCVTDSVIELSSDGLHVRIKKITIQKTDDTEVIINAI